MRLEASQKRNQLHGMTPVLRDSGRAYFQSTFADQNTTPNDDDDDDGQCPPNPRPVGDQDMAQEDAPEQPASPIIQELAERLAQLHLDVPPAQPAIPVVPAIPAIPAPIPAPAQVVAGVQRSGRQRQPANKNKEYQ